MAELRDKKPEIKITPRFHCADFTPQHYEEWFKEDNISQFIKILLRRLKYITLLITIIDIVNSTE